jgi:hypothetical protein
LTLLISALVIAAAVVWSAQLVVGQLTAARDERRRAHAVSLLQLFAPAIGAVQQDPRALLVWQPLARSARALEPDAFAALDRAIGATFPFTTETLQAAHARWTADWLAWERSHDATYKRKALEAQHALADASSPVARAQLEAIEQEKLELYQRRYEEYVRVAKALQSLTA